MLSQTFIRVFARSAIALAVTVPLHAQSAQYKHVAVAPEQMVAQQLPAAQAKGIFSHSTMLPVTAKTLTNSKGLVQNIHLDGAANSPIVFLSPKANDYNMRVVNPQGQVVLDESASQASAVPVSDIKMGPQTFSGKRFSIDAPMAGQWQVTLTAKATPAIDKKQIGRVNQNEVVGYLLFKGDSEFQAYSYLDNNFTTLNNDINVVAYMVDAADDRGERQAMVAKEPTLNRIDSAVALVKSPSGKQYRLTLNDQGINGDALAGDGKYSAHMPSDEIGVYTNQVQINGHRGDGKLFSRTTTDIYPVAAKSFELVDAAAKIKPLSGNKAVLSVPVKALDDSANVYMSAEVWGTNSAGEQQAATWVGGIVEPRAQRGQTTLDLSFDTRWLSRAGLAAPYSLKSVRLQTVDMNIPLTEKAQLPLQTAGKLNLSLQSAAAKNTSVSEDMLMSASPYGATDKTQQQADAAAPTGGPALLLVHGYCSSQAWKESDFYQSAEFKDYKQSISHNTFAQRVKNFGAAYSSYGIVAHSQGGAAALELYTKYYSGLDNAGSGRLIQSVGTPYQGTALAGNLAAIGDVFGAGCGKNTDLTYSGASNWLATIPSWAKAKVNYYTTSFSTSWWSYDYCHLATDLFLDDPEDGTTEKWSGQLSGAVNKGHKTGWCHTGGMRDPAQTTDSSRNATMSANAAR